MTAEKRSTLQLLGLPSEFGLVLLTLALILAISPYLGGTDLGLFKVPAFSPAATRSLRYLGPLVLVSVVLLFPKFWGGNSKQPATKEQAVADDSKYSLQSIGDIMRVEAAKHGVHIEGIHIGDRLHINDLQRICSKAWFPERPIEEVSRVLGAARAKAFSTKYAAPHEDEKLVNVGDIAIEGLETWDCYLLSLLRDLGVTDLNAVDVLNVGIGNGYAEEPVLRQLHTFRAVDISSEALEYAYKKYPQMVRFVCPAEELTPIQNNSVDLYLSLRVYQSTLFDRRSALHEAYRVLRSGGLIVLSIPALYLGPEGEALNGLIPPGSTVPDIGYAHQIADRIRGYMETLNFREVKTDERSPFEIFLSARL